MGIKRPVIPPLTTRGADIINGGGQSIRLAGVNWPGAHQDHRVPSMLDRLSRDEIAARIAEEGFNHVRLTWATGTFSNKDGTPYAAPADGGQVAANPDLRGAAPWDVYWACVDALAGAGLAVITNQHLHFPGCCCSDTDVNGLWYNDNWPAEVFTSTWIRVAQASASRPLVVGHDLHNEWRPAKIGGQMRTPTWGTGSSGSFPTDARLLMQNITGRIRAEDPDCLAICEGLNYASDLSKAGAYPVTGKGIVYSLHDYKWFHPDGQSQAGYFDAMDTRGGYLARQGIAPLWIGEWGSDNARIPGTPRGSASGSSAAQEQWFANIRAWLAARPNVGWCWWQWPAWWAKATRPGTNELVYDDGHTRTTYGIVAGQDGKGTSTDLLGLLKPLM